MAATRMLRMSTPLGFKSAETLVSNLAVACSRPRTQMCLNKVRRLSSDISLAETGERKPVAVKAAAYSACTVILEPKIRDKGLDMGSLFADKLSHWSNLVREQRSWGLHIQRFVEKAIINCRFITLLAVGRSLVCSVLCFLEGCVLVMVSYLQYFQAISQMFDQGQVVLNLIEAIDMFIMGTAMLVFATALYVMFIGQNTLVGQGNNLNPKKLPAWVGTGSAMEAKAKIGHAVMLILQVQVLEKFKSITVTNGMDLACFAGAIFLSAASIFVLSRIAIARVELQR